MKRIIGGNPRTPGDGLESARVEPTACVTNEPAIIGIDDCNLRGARPDVPDLDSESKSPIRMHGDNRANAGEGERHDANERPVTQADQG